MRLRMAWWLGLPALAACAWSLLSLSLGQTPPASPPAPPAPSSNLQPPGGRGPTPSPTAQAKPLNPDGKPQIDPSKLPPLQKQMYWVALRGADWLYRMNGQDGRFVYGQVPALGAPMEGDHYLRQIGAAFALARAARFTGEERYAARATQAVLLLLDDTATDPNDPQVRHTIPPSSAVNRLAAAGLLVLAIQELPAPQQDLLEKSEQLCNFIRKQQRGDGSLSYGDNPDEKSAALDPDGINYYPGEALYGLMRSQARQPAPWKIDLVRKALSYYGPWWRQHKNMAFVPSQTAAYVEAYLLTREQPFADLVNEMNDWICTLQYDRPVDARQALWYGGFKSWEDGKVVETAPQVGSASYAEGLAEAGRLARAAGDLQHYQRYSETLERCLQFLATLQYTEANTGHFADWYRRSLLGAFHGSRQDGNVRIDYTQHALCALTCYLTYVVRGPQ